MVSLPTLWLPILLSAVITFIVSSFIHMVLPYHRKDYEKLPDEDAVREALGKMDIPPGDYVVPCAENAKDMRNAEYTEKCEQGPVAFMTFVKNGPPSMTGSLFLWFLFLVVVGVFAAYIAGRALGPGAPYLSVFRFTGAVAFAGHSLALMHSSIWFHRKWSTTFKSMFDGLIYAVFTAGIFGWLWPGI